MTPWCHLIHRRPIDEFTVTERRAIPEVGEWIASSASISDQAWRFGGSREDIAEQITVAWGVQLPPNYQPIIVTWQYDCEDTVLSFYEAGYYDGLRNQARCLEVDIPSYPGEIVVPMEDVLEYGKGYEDGLGTFLLADRFERLEFESGWG